MSTRQYLYRKQGQKNKAHYWDGTDTACRMWSTGGMSQDREWVVSSSPDGHPVCQLCKDRPEVRDYPAQPQGSVRFLAVPYEDRHEASILGARFHPGRRLWYVPSGMPRHLFRWPDAAPQKGEPQFTMRLQARTHDHGHIWNGTDTACVLSSLGEDFKGWVVVRSLGIRTLCPLCKRFAPKGPPPPPGEVVDKPADLPRNWKPTQGGKPEPQQRGQGYFLLD